MNWILPDPDPLGLPLQLGILQALLLFTFVLHVLVMNIVVAGGPLALWSLWRGRNEARQKPGQPPYRALAGGLARLLPVSTAFTVTTGVAPLLFVQVIYGQVFYTSSDLMAWLWLSAVVLLLGGYYAFYGLAYSLKGSNGPTALWLALGAGVAFALVAFIFVNNMTLMLRPDRFGDLYLASDAGLHANLSDPTLLPRFLHFVVGAFALTGIAVAWLGRVRARRDAAAGAWILTFGVRLFGVATLVQLAVGAWFVASQPEYIRRVLLGGGPDSMVLAMGIIFALLAIPLMRMSVALASIAGAIAVADMVIVRHLVRTLALTPYFRPDTIPVNPQIGVFLVFAVLLVAGLATVAWMVTRLVVGRGEQTEGVGN
jgi:hypothetical protein